MKRSVWMERGRKSYSVRWYEDGKKQRAWCPDFLTAQRKLVETKQRLLALAQGLGDVGAKPLDVFEQYIAALSLMNRRPNTILSSRNCLPKFLSQFRKMSDITTNRIKEWREELLRTYPSPTSVRIHLVRLRAFLNWCVKEERIQVSPFKDIQIPPSRERGRKLTLDEAKRILRASEVKFRPFLMMLAYTGARVGETRKAKWEDIDGDMWTLPPENNKTRLGRVLAIHPDVLKALGPKKTGLVFPHIKNVSANWYLHKAVKAAGIDGKVTPHDLRHTFASHWKGHPMQLMRQMGWKSMAMLNRYFHIGAEELKRYAREFGIGAELAKLPGKSGADLGRFDVTSPEKGIKHK